ncbi:TOTE conflict system archaeo-eukaryotic primase domain-containing protein [Alicyclobacillus fastidiosus]|uniref:TOTE conflict system primase domain-containing protein n=1 Tax=Alicyclobacillus fastidiosus TaxID=392011 RepID=A0ABV5AIC3_9BACL|nr:hypothetical protein [Alicyclobacillus fastidiosus]WEH11137.1 hypothetical protein PYS47_07940 [Alicyclobacillus fastidiosus]
MYQRQIDLSSYPVPCPVCGEQLVCINATHARKHGHETLSDFLKTHGIDYKTLLQRSRKKLTQLYNIDRKSWVVGYETAVGSIEYARQTYYTDYRAARDKGIKSATPYPLTNTMLHNHLNGSAPLAIFASGPSSSYFGFDVDSKELAASHTLKLVDSLEALGIPRQYVHVSFSGSKGYHIDLLIDGKMSFEKWNDIGEYVVEVAGLTDESIEFRPGRKNGQAYKLPLTLHPKTGNFAGFCDNRTLESYDIVRSHNYLFDIEKMPQGLLFPLLARSRQWKREQVEAKKRPPSRAARPVIEPQEMAVAVTSANLLWSAEDKRDKVERWCNVAFDGVGTRYNAMKHIAIYLWHEQGIEDEDELVACLVEINDREYTAGRVRTPSHECVNEYRAFARWVINETDGFYVRERELMITQAEIQWVLGVTDIKARDMLWALLLSSKAFPSKSGWFYRTSDALQKMLSKPRKICRETIAVKRRWLTERGYIETTAAASKREFYVNHIKQHRPMRYRLLFDHPEHSVVLKTVFYDHEMDCRNLLCEIAATLLPVSELKLLKLTA